MNLVVPLHLQEGMLAELDRLRYRYLNQPLTPNTLVNLRADIYIITDKYTREGLWSPECIITVVEEERSSLRINLNTEASQWIREGKDLRKEPLNINMNF